MTRKLTRAEIIALPADEQFGAAPVAASQPQDYASLFRTASVPAAPVGYNTTNNNVTAPVTTTTTVNVTVPGGPEVANRVGKVVGKTVETINLRAAQRALVPTPGGG